MGALAAALIHRATLLALLTLVALLFGDRLAHIAQIDRLAATFHRFAASLGRKLNRPNRSVPTLVYRGLIALIIMEVIAIITAAFLMQHGTVFEIAGALVTIALLGRGFHTSRLFTRWQQARKGVLMLEQDDRLFADTHGVLRHTITSSAEQFATRVVGSGFWFVIGGMPAMFAYLALAVAAAHYTPSRQENFAFGLVATQLYRLTSTPPRAIAALLLLIAGCCIPNAHPIAATKILLSSTRSWLGMIADLLGISLGGRIASEAGEIDVPWQGSGTAQATVTHLTHWLMLLAVATLLWLLLLFTVALIQ